MILDSVGIQKILPHRPPFLMVDNILEIERLKRIVGLKSVSINESYFQGHFPGKPIMPGVLIIEGMAQTGGVLLLLEIPDRDKKLLYFAAVDEARFRRPVVPGDQLRMEVTVLKYRPTFCKLHAVVRGPARIGRKNIFDSFCSVGGDPQDLKFNGERTELVVGDANRFREFSTVSRGTTQGGGVTRIGSGNLFMAYSHVAHDCIVGSDAVFANGATLAGHVTIEDYANVGAFSPVHQFCRVGRYAYIGACTVITQDVPPFSRVVTERETHCYGVNTVGLERRGFNRERLDTIESAFRLLLRSKLNTSQALEQIRAQLNGSPDVRELVEFIESAERGLHK